MRESNYQWESDENPFSSLSFAQVEMFINESNQAIKDLEKIATVFEIQENAASTLKEFAERATVELKRRQDAWSEVVRLCDGCLSGHSCSIREMESALRVAVESAVRYLILYMFFSLPYYIL